MSVDTVDIVAVISDLHTGEYRGEVRFDPEKNEFKEVAELAVGRVNDLNPDLVFVLGDVTANGRPEEYEKVVKFSERFHASKIFTRGQKDYNSQYPGCFEEFFGEPAGHYEFGDLAVFAVDSVDPDRSKINAEIGAIEISANKGKRLTPDERAKVMKELGDTIIGYELAKDSGAEDFVKQYDYYSNVIGNYLYRLKRLEAILKTDLDYGFVGRRERKKLTEGLKGSRATIKMIITHYSPFTDYADNELVDRGALLRACVEENVNLLAVGDKHISNVYTHNQGGRPEKPVMVFQAGSLTNRQRDPNQYGVIKIDREKRQITVCSYLVETGEPATNRFWGNPYFPVIFSY